MRALLPVTLAALCLAAIPLAPASPGEAPAGPQPPDPSRDLLAPEFVLAFSEAAELVAYAIDNADPKPELIRSVTMDVRGSRVVERHSLHAIDQSGNIASAEVQVTRILGQRPPRTRNAEAQFLSLTYSAQPPEELPEHALRAAWDIGGNLRQDLRVAGGIRARAEFDGRETHITAAPPHGPPDVEVREAGPVMLELRTEGGRLAMRATAGMGADAFPDWEKLLAARLPPTHRSHATAGFLDTSEYMVGTVAIQVILMESNGTVDPNLENWTAQRRVAVMNEVNQSLAFWRFQGTTRTHPLAFVVDFTRAVAPLATRFEPITRCGPNAAGCANFDDLWITEAMAQLGYTQFSTTTMNMRQRANDLRNATGADWAFLLLVVDSDRDADGQFSNNFSAYGKWLGGPAVIMTFDNGNWGITRMDQVFAHELAHQFYALDEYNTGFGCTTTSNVNTMTGYLNVNNANCEVPNANAACNCLMRNNNLVLSASTIRQIGWRDTDLDGISDPMDTAPASGITGPSSPTSHYVVQYTGAPQVTPLPNLNPWNPAGRDVSLDRLRSARFRVDGGAWTALAAVDGAFDSHHESVRFPLFLQPGNHTVEMQADNTIPRANVADGSNAGPLGSHTLRVLGTRNSAETRIQALSNLSTSAGSMRPMVAADGNNVYVSFVQVIGGAEEVQLLRSTDGGQTWSGPVNVSAQDSLSSASPVIAAAGGTVLVAYWERNATIDRVLVRRSTDGGASFGSATTLAMPAARPALAMAGSSAHVVYDNFGSTLTTVEYRRSTDGGATWQSAVTLSNASGGTGPAVAISGTAVHAAWSGGGVLLYRRSTDGGGTWGAQVQISSNPSPPQTRALPAIAAAGSAVHLFWSDKRLVGGSTVGDVMYARSLDGGQNWGSQSVFSPGTPIDTGVAVAAGGTDVHVVWEDRSNQPVANLFYRRSEDVGGSWTDELRIQATDAFRASLALGGADVHLVWYDSRTTSPGAGMYYRFLR